MKKQNYWTWLIISSIVATAISLVLILCFDQQTLSFPLRLGIDLLLSELVVILILRRLIAGSNQPVSVGKTILLPVLGQLIKSVFAYGILFIYIQLKYFNATPAGDVVADIGYALTGSISAATDRLVLMTYILYYTVYLFCSVVLGVAIGLLCAKKWRRRK